jgi:PAS domain-containing protein
MEFVYRARHRSGAFRRIRSSIPIKNADGTVREWIGSDEDIHAWREVEETLRVSEKRHRLALSAAHMVTWDYEFTPAPDRRWALELRTRPNRS